MNPLHNKVAVITGAASGFGRELAIACANEGMRLALTDIDEKNLQGTADLLPSDTHVLTMKCDVAQAEQVEQLAVATYARFGAAHLLFNNAGVLVGGPLWTTTAQDWAWMIGINVMGVAHGIRSFVPRMLAQKDQCHIVNTASVAGLLSVPGNGIYCATKHAVVTMSECLQLELQEENASIGVSVLCPAFVPTGIADAGRNRPAELADTNPLKEKYEAQVRKATQAGRLSAADIARITLDAVKQNRFYILPHQKIKSLIEMRMGDILDERSPTQTPR
ncbi:SDR family NAD(P)-dependent oxidoreductase [Pseudomonas sp. MPC6]|jgi:NAD(P)-dependent dehydrogenase (short-subunit alcohol dehydrogenase family)|uniref:SDR family NAD(P)-dependent oxidoreductase n=1 Tax=unclassified Pseudomonas TaxID=196821 RepID=UPI001110930A|nr:SDR family NAD(P)-dependent oxidoreductase [Pseudomonas sp. MPC6]QCY11658.1 SDR family NAD(P)-dependent oxidoreductase [Pseudomonas sp. MPC6]